MKASSCCSIRLTHPSVPQEQDIIIDHDHESRGFPNNWTNWSLKLNYYERLFGIRQVTMKQAASMQTITSLKTGRSLSDTLVERGSLSFYTFSKGVLMHPSYINSLSDLDYP